MGLGTGGGGKGTRSPLKIFVNIFVSFIGAGVLGLPYTIRQSGILEGVVIMLVVSIFSVKAMLLIIECKYTVGRASAGEDGQGLLDAFDDLSLGGKSNGTTLAPSKVDLKGIDFNNLTYAELGYCVGGVSGRRLVELSIVVSQLGFCCAYLIFITENLSSYLPAVSRTSWLAILLPILFLLSLKKELHQLAFFSLFAQVSNMLAFAVVFWFDFDHIQHAKHIMEPSQWSWDGFPFFFAVAIYCYEGAGMILALESSVAQDSRHKFKRYFITTIVVVTTLYITFGVAGYLSFGNKTNPIITLNLPTGTGKIDFAMLVKLCLCISLFFTYPVMLFPVRELLEKLIGEGRGWGTGLILRLALVLTTGAVVTFIPSFANLMALIGATCCSLLAFILPASFHLLLHPHADKWSRLTDYWLLVLGFLAAIMGTVDTLHRLQSREDVVNQAVARGPLPNGTDPHSAFTETDNLTAHYLHGHPNHTSIRALAHHLVSHPTPALPTP